MILVVRAVEDAVAIGVRVIDLRTGVPDAVGASIL